MKTPQVHSVLRRWIKQTHLTAWFTSSMKLMLSFEARVHVAVALSHIRLFLLFCPPSSQQPWGSFFTVKEAAQSVGKHLPPTSIYHQQQYKKNPTNHFFFFSLKSVQQSVLKFPLTSSSSHLNVMKKITIYRFADVYPHQRHTCLYKY